jgi:hypothetical protein
MDYRVHYPLPLNYAADQPLPAEPVKNLIPTIQYEIHALRDDQKRHVAQIAKVHSSYIDFKLTKENDRLKYQLNQVEKETSSLMRDQKQLLGQRQMTEIFELSEKLVDIIQREKINSYTKSVLSVMLTSRN